MKVDVQTMKMKMSMQGDSKTFKEGFEEFVRYCKVRNYSESTVGNYNQLVKQLNQYWDVQQQ
jgi:hypothetical protein